MSDLEKRLEATRVDLMKRLVREDRPVHGLESLIRRMGRITLRKLKPRPREDIVTWAEREIFLNNQSSPGRGGKPLRLSNFQKQMLRMMVAGTTKRFICRKSSQIGYSLLCAIAVFYVLAHLGLPAAYISRSDAEVDRWMKTFFHPMLNDPNNKVLARIKRTPKQGEDKDSLNEKIFRNGAMFFARTAASDDATKGFTAWMVICDEIDADTWIERAAGQGSKLDAIRARFIQFHDGRLVAGGTPTNARTSTRVVWIVRPRDRRAQLSRRHGGATRPAEAALVRRLHEHG